MRHVPELHFHYDDSVDRGERIEPCCAKIPNRAESHPAKTLERTTP